MPSGINLTDGLELLRFRLALTAHWDASSPLFILTRSLLRLNHHWVKTRGAFSCKLHKERSISTGWARYNGSKTTERTFIGDIISKHLILIENIPLIYHSWRSFSLWNMISLLYLTESLYWLQVGSFSSLTSDPQNDGFFLLILPCQL